MSKQHQYRSPRANQREQPPSRPKSSSSSSSVHPLPKSCDTFVYVAGDVKAATTVTKNGDDNHCKKGTRSFAPSGTVFGKNSDRPSDESHEVLHVPRTKHPSGSTVQCTYITIPQVPQTYAVILSKPAWMWGCEMGSNEYGVVGGNEAVSTMLAGEIGADERLLGMDLLRLALERGKTAKDATIICRTLLEKYGQGGCCSEEQDGWTYENGFIFADAKEAFVLETAGIKHWAVERVGPGKARNISNGLSIRTSIESCSDEIKDICRDRGWWDGKSLFDWKACVGAGGRSAGRGLEIWGRERAGADHLRAMTAKLECGKLDANDSSDWIRAMATVLRDEKSGICFRDLYGFCSTGSQISWIPKPESGKDACHFFTASSDPIIASYKRFVFRKDDDDHEKESKAPTDHKSLQLWKRWRDIALQGGLERCYSKKEFLTIRGKMRSIEEEAITGSVTDTPDSSPLSFAEAIEKELSLLANDKQAT